MSPFSHRHVACLAASLLVTGCNTARQAVHAPQIGVATEKLAESDSSAVLDAPNRVPKPIQITAGLIEERILEESEIVQVGASDGQTLPLLPEPDEFVPTEDIMLAGSSAWTLSNLESLALQHNPAIQEQSASAHKAMGFRDQVGRKPNPTVGYSGNQFADAGTDQHVAFIEQEFVLGGKLKRNQAVLTQEVQSQLWEVESRRYRVLTDVRQNFYDALAAQRRLALAAEFHEVAQKGVEIAQARRDAQEGSVPEVLQAEIQLKQIDVQRKRNEAAYRAAWKQLMAVIGLPNIPQGELQGELPHSSEVLEWDLAKGTLLAASPELQAARARVSRAQANLDRQRVQAIPNVSIMLAAGRDNGTGSGMINAQVGLPVPIFNKNEGNISAANAELCRASLEVRRIEMSIEARLARAAQIYEAALATVELYEQEILPRAAESLKLAEQAYAAGEYGFLQVLVARRTYFDANLEFVVAQAELAQANAYIEGQVLSGGLDETRNTELESGLRDQALSGQ